VKILPKDKSSAYLYPNLAGWLLTRKRSPLKQVTQSLQEQNLSLEQQLMPQEVLMTRRCLLLLLALLLQLVVPKRATQLLLLLRKQQRRGSVTMRTR
jgi:hypothetical protein